MFELGSVADFANSLKAATGTSRMEPRRTVSLAASGLPLPTF